MKLRFVCALALGVVILVGGGLSKPNSYEDEVVKDQLVKADALLPDQAENKQAQKD